MESKTFAVRLRHGRLSFFSPVVFLMLALVWPVRALCANAGESLNSRSSAELIGRAKSYIEADTRLAVPVPGINIIRYSDGTVRKVLVR